MGTSAVGIDSAFCVGLEGFSPTASYSFLPKAEVVGRICAPRWGDLNVRPVENLCKSSSGGGFTAPWLWTSHPRAAKSVRRLDFRRMGGTRRKGYLERDDAGRPRLAARGGLSAGFGALPAPCADESSPPLRRPAVRLVPLRRSGLQILACSHGHARRRVTKVRRTVMSPGGSPRFEASAAGKALPHRPRVAAPPESATGRASEWLELAEGTMREALAERLAQAHLTETQRD